MKKQIDFKQKIQSFSEKLGKINPMSITHETYCNTYLSHLLTHRLYYLEIYAAVIQRVVSHIPKPIHEIKVIDFGAGNGLLGLFAAFCGFEKIVLHERDASFFQSAQKLAEVLEISQCLFVCGDENKFSEYDPTFEADALISTDVIEHVYDVDAFIKNVRSKFPNCMMVHTTAANAANPFITRRLKKLQLKDEWKGSHPKLGKLAFAESHASYYSIRKKIILTVSKDIDHEMLNILTIRTRGMIEEDIVHSVQNYLNDGVIPQEPAHPTNTCNPYTGSWTERLISAEEYRNIFQKYYQHFLIDPGFYNEFISGMKAVLYEKANIYIKKTGLTFSPFILITAY